MKKEIEYLRDINYLLEKRCDFLQELILNIRHYLEDVKSGNSPLSLEDLLKMLD